MKNGKNYQHVTQTNSNVDKMYSRKKYCKCIKCKPYGHVFKTSPKNPVNSYFSDKTSKWYFGLHFATFQEVSERFTFITFTKKISNMFYPYINLLVLRLNNFCNFRSIFFY